MPIRFRLSTLLLIVAVAAVILFFVDNSSVVIWDGRFPLEVNLLGTQNREITEVAFDLLFSVKFADYVRTATNNLALNLETIDWVEGQPFTVQVPCSGRTSSFGRELRYSQFQLLVLRISYTGGAVEFIPVEIPDGRTSRKVNVEIAKDPPNS